MIFLAVMQQVLLNTLAILYFMLHNQTEKNIMCPPVAALCIALRLPCVLPPGRVYSRMKGSGKLKTGPACSRCSAEQGADFRGPPFWTLKIPYQLTFILPFIAMLTKEPETLQPGAFCEHEMQQNATAAGAPPRIPLGELTALPQIS